MIGSHFSTAVAQSLVMNLFWSCGLRSFTMLLIYQDCLFRYIRLNTKHADRRWDMYCIYRWAFQLWSNLCSSSQSMSYSLWSEMSNYQSWVKTLIEKENNMYKAKSKRLSLSRQVFIFTFIYLLLQKLQTRTFHNLFFKDFMIYPSKFTSFYYKQLFLQIIQYKRNTKLNMEPEKVIAPKKQEQKVKKNTQQILKVQISDKQSSMPTLMENKHVYEVYDRIAPHFSHTRYKPWPKIEKFLKEEMKDGDIVMDVGCGNGKYMGVNPNLYMIGTDRSMGLLKTASQKNEFYQLFGADSLYLPVRSGVCDGFISIAVVHHFSTQKIRHRAIDEMTRILKVGGIGLIYVWAFEQDFQGNESVSKKKFTEQDVFVPWHLHFKYEKDLENIDTQGCEIDLEKKSVIYKRYYHVFKQGELENLLKYHQDLQILQSYYDRENWCCKVKKLK